MYFLAYIVNIMYYKVPPVWGLGEGLTTPHCKKKNSLLTKYYIALRNWWILAKTVINTLVLLKTGNFMI